MLEQWFSAMKHIKRFFIKTTREKDKSGKIRTGKRINHHTFRQDDKFSEDFRGKSNLEHYEWSKKKLKDCVNKNQYDKKIKTLISLQGFPDFLTWNIKSYQFYRCL